MTDRAAFEAFAELHGLVTYRWDETEAYTIQETRVAWQFWQEAARQEREAISSLVEQMTLRERQARSWGDAKPVAPCEITAAIRSRSPGEEH